MLLLFVLLHIILYNKQNERKNAKKMKKMFDFSQKYRIIKSETHDRLFTRGTFYEQDFRNDS